MDISHICQICGKSFTTPHWRNNVKYCSQECQHRGIHAKPNTICSVCGKEYHLKPSQKSKIKESCCSRECAKEIKRLRMTGQRNHQYGLRGNLNASYREGVIHKKNNKVTDNFIYVGTWYLKSNGDCRVVEHRYLVEKNWHLFDNEFFEEIDGWHYLKDGIEVHHKDFNHDNNDLSNLIPLTKSEHISIHNKARNQKRNSLGQFIKL